MELPNWYDRLLPAIYLKSPNGRLFTAQWRGDDRKLEKNLGVFEFPFYGTVVQDMGVRATRYPLTLFFEGPANDLTVHNFEEALSEDGPWEIVHPTKGPLKLQPVSFTIKDQPVENGGITEVGTEWIESQEALSPVLAMIAAVMDAMATACGIASTAAGVANFVYERYTETQATRLTGGNALTEVSEKLSALAGLSAEIRSRFDTAIRTAENILSQANIDMAQLSGAVQNAVQIPLYASDNFETRVDVYRSLTDSLIAHIPETAEAEDRNRAAIIEMFLSAIIVADALIVRTSAFQTRAQAVQAAQFLSDQFSVITDALDVAQDAFKDSDIDLQYFSQGNTYTESYRLTYQAIAFAIRSAMDLTVEKRYVVKNPVATIRFVIEKYGGLGDGDEYIDRFIALNRLKGNEILLLPRGREVVVYGR